MNTALAYATQPVIELPHDDDVYMHLARTQEEERVFQRLLYRVYCEELSWLPPGQYPDGRVHDENDARSSFILIKRDGHPELAGGIRVVHHSDGKLFPHEHLLEHRLPIVSANANHDFGPRVKDFPRSSLAEITRLISARKKNRLMILEMIKALYWYARYNELSAYFVMIDMSVFRLSVGLGSPIVPIGIPQYCEGSWVIPGLIVIDDIPCSIRRKSPTIWKYISDTQSLRGNWRKH